jgi:lipopolysaccharide/colanic/teichoic acid biosynthesis glycosyltransferase
MGVESGSGRRQVHRHGLVVPVAAGVLLGLALAALAGRAWAVGALPAAASLALVGWAVLRRRQRPQTTRVLAVGSHDRVTSLIVRTRDAPDLGWAVVGVCTPTGTGTGGGGTVAGVPVVGDLDAVPALARTAAFDTVCVARTPGWSARRMQELAWHLEGSDTQLVLDPALLEFAGPRTRLGVVGGLQLLRLDRPVLPAAARLLKSTLDSTAALVVLAVIAPLLLAVALAVCADGGPAFVREERVGTGGRTFRMLAFRCTSTRGTGVTRIGALLQRCSLHELPQLLNVVAGSMAFVGPRPLRPGEAAGPVPQAPVAKPGVTGLWPAARDRDDATRIELRYVETWTPALDTVILFRALRATKERHSTAA